MLKFLKFLKSPLWCNGMSSRLSRQRSGFKSQRDHIFFINSWFSKYTLSNKEIHLLYSIRMSCTNIWRPAVCVKQNIFELKINKICSLSNNASFDTLWFGIYNFSMFSKFQLHFFLCWGNITCLFLKKCLLLREYSIFCI